MKRKASQNVSQSSKSPQEFFLLKIRSLEQFTQLFMSNFTVPFFKWIKLQKDAQGIFDDIHGWKEEIPNILELVIKCLYIFFCLSEAKNALRIILPRNKYR